MMNYAIHDLQFDEARLYFQIPITLHKETELNVNGEEVMKCGFKIGGGIDQDFRKSPQGYTDNVTYS